MNKIISCEMTRDQKNFTAGVLNVAITFFYTSTPRNEQFGIQIKLPRASEVILHTVTNVLRVSYKPRTYGAYTKFTTRSTREIAEKIMPFCEGNLYGQKLIDYIKWKQKFITRYAPLEKNA